MKSICEVPGHQHRPLYHFQNDLINNEELDYTMRRPSCKVLKLHFSKDTSFVNNVTKIACGSLYYNNAFNDAISGLTAFSCFKVMIAPR